MATDRAPLLCTPRPRCYINRGAGFRTVNSKPVIQGSEAPTVPRLDFRRRRRPARQGKLKNYFRITLAARTSLGPTLLARCLNSKYKVYVSPYYTCYSRHSEADFQLELYGLSSYGFLSDVGDNSFQK